jgi:large subunit ribosomal protein L6
VFFDIPAGLTIETPKPTQIHIKGASKQLVGQFAANVRKVRPPEPYKGKGIRYEGEQIQRKAGKAVGGKTA